MSSQIIFKVYGVSVLGPTETSCTQQQSWVPLQIQTYLKPKEADIAPIQNLRMKITSMSDKKFIFSWSFWKSLPTDNKKVDTDNEKGNEVTPRTKILLIDGWSSTYKWKDRF